MTEPHRYLGLAELKNEGSGGPVDLGTYRFRWLDLLRKEMSDQHEDWAEALVDAGTLAHVEASVRPYSDEACKPWCVWTDSRVYFPVVYDGSYSVGSASRNPTVGGAGPFGGGW